MVRPCIDCFFRFKESGVAASFFVRRLCNGAPDYKTTGPQHNHSKQGAMNIHEAAVLILVKLGSYFHQRCFNAAFQLQVFLK